MVKTEMYKGETVYVCEECGFGYRERRYAKMCEDFCRTHGACSMEIAKYAVMKPGV